jgi:hypothetical protein
MGIYICRCYYRYVYCGIHAMRDPERFEDYPLVGLAISIAIAASVLAIIAASSIVVLAINSF